SNARYFGSRFRIGDYVVRPCETRMSEVPGRGSRPLAVREPVNGARSHTAKTHVSIASRSDRSTRSIVRFGPGPIRGCCTSRGGAFDVRGCRVKQQIVFSFLWLLLSTLLTGKALAQDGVAATPCVPLAPVSPPAPGGGRSPAAQPVPRNVTVAEI